MVRPICKYFVIQVAIDFLSVCSRISVVDGLVLDAIFVDVMPYQVLCLLEGVGVTASRPPRLKGPFSNPEHLAVLSWCDLTRPDAT